MRDKYVGDIGDFAKYGLLRAVGQGRRLGVAWYLCANPERPDTGDGRHTGYLRDPGQWRRLDCDLFDTLKGLVDENRRSVSAIRKSGILGDAAFAEKPVDAAFAREPIDARVPVRERENWRRQWFDGVLDRLYACDLVFVDPDNGLCTDERLNPRRKESAKRIPVSEVMRLAAGRSVIVYHHNGRGKGGHIPEINEWMSHIQGCAFAWYWRRWSNRTFLVINPDPEMECRIERFVERWRGTGELVRAASSE